MTVRGVKDTVALNLLENDWSSVVQWMYHQLRKRGGKRRGSSTQSFLPPSLVQNNCSRVLAFWQASSREDEEGILRIFLCRRLDDDGLRVEKDVHSFPVNHTTVSFTRAVHLVYHCLGGRLFSLSFIECIAAKLAYLELSNVFTLTRENTVWIVTHNATMTTTDNNKLMVGARFMLDDFVQCFPTMHAYTMVNQFSRFVGDYSVDSTKSDDVTTAAGDYVSHIECRHERIEPLVGDQDFITPHRLNGSFSCNVCSHGNSPLLLGNNDDVIHVCSLIREVCYASRSFLIHYNVDSGTDHDVSQQELSITLDNVSSFFFYRPKAAGGKDISVYREEAIRTLTDFMDNQLVKFEKDRPTSHRLCANELRKHLSRVDQPLKKVNNDKGEVRKQNHANALIILRERGFVQKYLRDYERLYDMDIVEVRDDPSSSHVLKCVDYARCPMPSQLTVPLDTLQKLNTYFKSNQRFKKDKLRRAIEVDILPHQLDDDEAWERGWHVRVNTREFCQQLLSIQYRVRSGDRFNQRQRNELCLTNLYRLFNWDTYKEDIANIIKISVHERKLRNTMRYPLESTLRLDQFFDRDEMTCIALLNLAVFNHVCKSEEEYCFVCITPRPLRYPSQRGDGGGEEKKA